MPDAQERACDYPRPPRLERSDLEVVVVLGGQVIVRTTSAWRVLETHHPPTWYIPPDEIHPDALRPASGRSLCEWKGIATYYDVRGGSSVARKAAWTYLRPTDAFSPICDHVAFYPSAMDRCSVGGELVEGQAGDVYGGWITRDVEGPFKGEAGTEDW